MLRAIDQQLLQINRRLRAREKTRSALNAARDALRREQAHLGELAARLEAEQRDVRRLESPGLAALLATLRGQRSDRLAREQREALAARLAYETALAAVAALEADM